MARILFCEYSNVTWLDHQMFDAHAEAFIEALTDAGNEVLGIVTNHIVMSLYSNELRWWLIDNKIKDIVTKFSPDLIITYNNSLPGREILSYTDCPVLVYPADVFDIWADRQMISESIDRYYFLDSTSKTTEQIKKAFPSIDDKRIIPFGHVTGVKSVDINQDYNISFVGSLCNYAYDIPDYFAHLGENLPAERANEEKARFLQMYQKHIEDCSYVSGYDFEYGDPDQRNRLMTSINYELDTMISCNKRFEILSALTEYDIKIFGYPPSWSMVMPYNIDLFRCFDYHTSVTLEDTIKTYNRSKIVVNLPQGTSTDGFSWRVPDVLASNAVLLSVPKKDLKTLMEPYCKDYPYYESPSEANELAGKLLNDSNYRRELIDAAHEMVNDHFRFPKKFRTISQYIDNVNLFDSSGSGKARIYTSEVLCMPYLKIEYVLGKHYHLSKMCKKLYNICRR